MSYRSKRFNAGIRSLDVMATGRDVSKWRLFSDRGAGVERLTAAIDYDEKAEQARERAARSERAKALFTAEMLLVEAGRGYLIPVLLQIVENGNNRGASLLRIPPRTYYRHRAELLAFFSFTDP